MSASNLAVRMEHAASELPAHTRPELRVVANHEGLVQKRAPRLSLTNRKFLTRDQGLRYFRVR